LDSILQSLDATGYDEAAQYVYGMNYGDWKKRHSKKTSDEVLQKFNDSKSLWASHDKTILAKRSESPPSKKLGSASSMVCKVESENGDVPSSLLSNVCCQDIDAPTSAPAPPATKKSRHEVPPFQPPTPPKVSFSLGILTVSDRASSGEYESGDLSGPAVKKAVESVVTAYGDRVMLQSTKVAIVPDDMDAIQSQLKEWTDTSKLHLILTTGGTGFSPRDVTPEATNLVVDSVCEGLLTFCTMECAKRQPLAALSRGSAGIRGNSLIVNLPGNPKGVQEIIPVLLPLALHAVADLCG
jgi:molybdenum cofactor synthesis domain-containing protein